jgi:acyl-coenzyme A synthetase/AMP-(fatty) acid ligase
MFRKHIYIQTNYNIKPCDIIVLSMKRGYMMIVSILAIISIGCTYCPVHPDESFDRLNMILNKLCPSLILTDRSDVVKEDANIITCKIEEIPLYDKQDDSFELDVAIDYDSYVLYIIQTSGSTSEPKLIKIKEKGFIQMIQSISEKEIGYEMNKISIQLARCSFDVHILEIFGTLMSGGTLVLIDECILQDFNKLQSIINLHCVYTIDIVPSLLSQFISYAKHSRMLSVRLLVVGGEPSSCSLLEDCKIIFPNLKRIINMYGPAECTINCMANSIDLTNKIPSSISLGQPIKGFKIYITDEKELWISGLGVMKGYINSELDKQVFADLNGSMYYRTGDSVEQRDDQLYFTGRIDNQIKLNGQRIELLGIETIIQKHINIVNCIVRLESQDHVNILVAYTQLVTPVTTWKEDLIDHCIKYLPKYMIPSKWVLVQEFHLTPNGKLDRRSIPCESFILEETKKNTNESISLKDDKMMQMVVSYLDCSKTNDIYFLNLFEHLLVNSLQVISFYSKLKQMYPFFSLEELYSSNTLVDLVSSLKTSVNNNTDPYSFFIQTTFSLDDADVLELKGMYEGTNGVQFKIDRDIDQDYVYILAVKSLRTKSIIRKTELNHASDYFVCFTLDPFVPLDYIISRSNTGLWIQSKDKHPLRAVYLKKMLLTKI